VTRGVIRSILPLPDREPLLRHDAAASLAVSSDGGYVAYVAGDLESSRLYLRRVDVLEDQPIEGSAGAMTPFFSPDGEWLGFAKGRFL